MTDREMLELAAKASGIRLEWDGPPELWAPMYYSGKTYRAWNPLESDDEAFRIVVALQINLCFGANYVIADGVQIPTVNNANDPYSATRRAIVSAAAEMELEAQNQSKKG